MLFHFVSQSASDCVSHYAPLLAGKARDLDDAVHLDAAVAWLERSIDACSGRGSSKGYRVLKGWMPAYPETTGYIIPTLLDVAERRNRPELVRVANRLADWLIEIQLPNGGFVGRELGALQEPVAFNTGQILHGLNALLYRCDRQDLLASAKKAGDFLIGCADDSGCFVRNVSNGIIHTYGVRSAWALVTLGRISGDQRYETAGIANADWTVKQQTEDGFFLNNTFKKGGNANTHGLAYVLRGLIEVYELTGQERFLQAVRRTCDKVIALYGSRRRLVAELGPHWEELADYVCLTGYAQLSIVLFRLYGIDGDRRYLNAALNLLDEVVATQNLSAKGKPWHGAIKGSRPIYGRYAPLQYPNWATKFFVDALLAKEKAIANDAHSVPVQLSAG